MNNDETRRDDTTRREPAADAVERAARAMYELDPAIQRLWFSDDLKHTGFLDEPRKIEWEEIKETPRGEWLRRQARAALAAVEPVPSTRHLCPECARDGAQRGDGEG